MTIMCPNLSRNQDSTKAKWTATYPQSGNVVKLECIDFISIYRLRMVPFQWVGGGGAGKTSNV